MRNELHPVFQQILNDALKSQIEREKSKVVKPREWHPETYMEWHENREELQYLNNGYERSRF